MKTEAKELITYSFTPSKIVDALDKIVNALGDKVVQLDPIGYQSYSQSCMIGIPEIGADSVSKLSVVLTTDLNVDLVLVHPFLGQYLIPIGRYLGEWGFIASIVERWIEAMDLIYTRSESAFRDHDDWDTLEAEYNAQG
ncbi:MAG TPA: hypothetical protein V6D07_18495 [Trichocoleus sp.]